MNRILEARGLVKRFGGRVAVDNVDFDVERGEILGLIGPNGAGKTTLFNLVSGAIPPDAGSITFSGTPIGGLKPHRICRMGVARTFQAAKNFPGLSITQNVMMGALFGKRGATHDGARREAEEMLEFTGLGEVSGKAVSDLTLAGQKRLEVARALATKPKLLLLDEMMAGLNPTEVGEAMELVDKIRGSGVTIIMIEHVMRAIMNTCDRIIVLHHGQKIASGTPEEVSSSGVVIEVYLGQA
jgi:branched-chain amino acid transport system ATP-binding protein